MPSWKKIIQSGSSAELTQVTASVEVSTPQLTLNGTAITSWNDVSSGGGLWYDGTTYISSSLDTDLRISGSVYISGSIIPNNNKFHSLGKKGNSFKEIWAQDTYFGDVNLSNVDRGPNEVDGTQGSWTIQEGKKDLFLINRKNGKKYKFKLQEVKK